MNASSANLRPKRRACVTCTSAKSKCTPHSANLCERCARLNKECLYLDLPERRRKPRSTRRVDVLENKVDELTAQLAVFSQCNANTSFTAASESSSKTPGESSASIDDDIDVNATNHARLMQVANEELHGPEPPTGSVLEDLPDIVERGMLGLNDAEDLIHTFKTKMILKFPFVVLDPEQTAAMVKEQEPFLFLCIIAAALPPDHYLRKPVAAEIMHHVTSRIIAGSERSLELLRGLLVQSAWYSHPAQRGHTQLVMMIQICVTIAYDLGLHKKTNMDSDEQRSFLGAFWLSNGMARTLRRPSSMMHCRKIDECCRILSTSTAHTSDKWIEPMIRFKIFLSRIEKSYSILDDPLGSFHGTSFIDIVVGPFIRELEALKPLVHQDPSVYPSATRSALICDIHYAEMFIRDIALHDEYWDTKQNTNLLLGEPLENCTLRTSMLWVLIRQSKTFVLAFLEIPDDELPYVSTLTLGNLCTAITALPKAVSELLKFVVRHSPAPGKLTPNQKSEAQTIVDESGYLALVASLLKKFNTMLPNADGDTVTASLCSRMRLLAHYYAPRVKGILGVDLVYPTGDVAYVPESAGPETVHSQDYVWAGFTDPQVAELSYPAVGDSAMPFDDDLWAMVLDKMNDFA
ncbi:Transcription factor himD-like protein [Cladobotryum mycophilum]|uniref:Transcription factor himD-like protein n=1 Tax=Cladobotryum mycophilum TaxID=491253 RepID=A0ABR0SVT8_9HYPO